MDKISRIRALKLLRSDFNAMLKANPEAVSEEKIRSGFLNKLLEIFGWNLSNINEVIEEKKLQGIARTRLREIDSIHVKPDYILCKNGVPKMYLDAKNIFEDFSTSQENAFQIRSYAWSSSFPISIISNFQKFGIYNTTFKPHSSQRADFKSIFFTIDDLIEQYDIYAQFFDKDFIQEYKWILPSELDICLNANSTRTLDEDFFSLLDEFRLKLGNEILGNSNLPIEKLNYYVQIIINRILFVRILEDLNIETKGKLLYQLNSGNFWKLFNQDALEAYEKRYDGALFSEVLPIFRLENRAFEKFISQICIDTPYKFDVIPVNFLSEIYDLFLGRQLVLIDDELTISNKDLSPEGAVPTPYYLAESLVRETINMNSVESEAELFSMRILDPCVGSGTFLIATLEIFGEKLKELRSVNQLNYKDVKKIVTTCLFAIDIDPTAIEVLKMTISLKLLTGKYFIEEPLEKILSDLSNNFKYGNTIVQSDADIPFTEKLFQIPTNIEKIFPSFEIEKFNYIITNPPYIEPKHFKSRWPQTWKYLKRKYSFNDKIDISMFFLKRFFDLIDFKGKISVIVQKRFFRTEYGKAMRNYLVESGSLKRIIDFKSNKLFKNKITYVACIFIDVSNNTNSILYDVNSFEVNETYSNFDESLSNLYIESSVRLSNTQMINQIWSPRYFSIQSIIESKINSEELIQLKDIERINIGVGPQVLDSKFYFLSNIRENGKDKIFAINRRAETIEIEKAITRRVYRNEKVNKYIDFSQNDSTIVFPYTDSGNFISKNIMSQQYPKAFEYFKFIDKNSTTQRVSDAEEFYRYTRETKLNSYNRPKVFIPMTVINVTAVFNQKDCFGDNSNINTIMDDYDDTSYLKALCCVFNSPIFNGFAISLSGEASGGYHKLNKQFLANVPIPVLKPNDIEYLESLFDKIVDIQKALLTAFGHKELYFSNELMKNIDLVNKYIVKLYNLSQSELELILEEV